MANNKPFTISLSGKGFTSPKEYYSKLSNSIEADDYYTIWIDHTVIEAASGKEDDYNAICNPGDWNSKADIQLDEKLATEQYGIGFLLGNEELKDQVEGTLLEMVDDGTFATIAEKYGLSDSVCLGK